MKQLWTCVLVVWSLLCIPLVTSAADMPAAAFTRYQSLWLYENKTESQIHENIHVRELKWSPDGTWLLYEASPTGESVEDESEIWLYHAPSGSKTKLKLNGHDATWNPLDQTFAFLTGTTLCVVELGNNSPVIHQLTGGVSSFIWDAKGRNLIASASATLFPDGWSHPRLYEVHWALEKEEKELDVKVTPLHTISSPLKAGETSIMSVDVGDFSWSKDGKSLAMIVSPTASWAADSNMLSVLVKENKLFIPMGEVLQTKDWVKWAPEKPILASIQGGGRLAGGIKNKVLTTQTIIPSYKKSHTPKGFADIGFDWIDDERIIVARGKETASSTERFISTLEIVDLKKKKTSPFVLIPEGHSDTDPLALDNGDEVAWIRESPDGSRHVWMGSADGDDARKIIENVFMVEWFK